MRCLNCHTVLAGNDTRCVSCGAVTQIGHAQAAGILPVPTTPGKARGRKWGQVFGTILLGLVLLGAGAATFPNPEGENASGPKNVTADDLMKVAGSGTTSNQWVVYTPERVHDTGLKLVSGVPGRRQTTTRILLVPVGDRWLLTEVKTGFTGVRLEGQLQVWNSPMYQNLMQKVRREVPDKAGRLLPFQFNCENSFAQDARVNSLIGGSMAVIGLLTFVGGIGLAFVRPRQV